MDEDSRNNNVFGQLPDALRQLQEENVRLKALLAANGIPWDESIPSKENSFEIQTSSTIQRSAIEKVALFGQLFRGRTDVYPNSLGVGKRDVWLFTSLQQRVAERCLQ